jgi:hypothetical protein
MTYRASVLRSLAGWVKGCPRDCHGVTTGVPLIAVTRRVSYPTSRKLLSPPPQMRRFIGGSLARQGRALISVSEVTWQWSFLPRGDRLRPRPAERADTSNWHWQNRPPCDAAKHAPMHLRRSYPPGQFGERLPFPVQSVPHGPEQRDGIRRRVPGRETVKKGRDFRIHEMPL